MIIRVIRALLCAIHQQTCSIGGLLTLNNNLKMVRTKVDMVSLDSMRLSTCTPSKQPAVRRQLEGNHGPSRVSQYTLKVTLEDLMSRNNLTSRSARMVRNALAPPTDAPTPTSGRMSKRHVATETRSMTNLQSNQNGQDTSTGVVHLAHQPSFRGAARPSDQIKLSEERGPNAE